VLHRPFQRRQDASNQLQTLIGNTERGARKSEQQRLRQSHQFINKDAITLPQRASFGGHQLKVLRSQVGAARHSQTLQWQQTSEWVQPKKNIFGRFN
jgi:hypothetical protein